MTEMEQLEPMTGSEERHKHVPIHDSKSMSRHVIDLTSFSPNAPRGPRPDLDFWQKVSIWLHAIRPAGASKDERAIVPFMPHKKSVRRVSIVGFFKMLFGMLMLPFKPRPKALKKTLPKNQTHPNPLLISREGAKLPPIPVPRPPKAEKIRRAPTFVMPAWRHIAAFAAIALVISLPLQALLSYAGLLHRAGVIAADAQEAVGGLKEAGQDALKLDGSGRDSFERSAGAFAATRDRVDNIAVRLAALLTGNGEKLSSGSRLLAAGEAVSKAGADLSDGFDAMEKSQDTNAQKLARMAQALKAALPHLEDGVAQLDRVTVGSLPSAYRAKFAHIRDDAKTAVSDLRRTSDASTTLLDAIGANGKRRYLIVFQNSHELRPTGGFIGSYALMDLADGTIKNIEIPAGGSYDLRGGFNQRIAAPDQLRLVNPRWEFQDANWFADFPTSAQSLAWFYEKSGGPTIDGVIAVTSDLMEHLLGAIGPIAMPEHGKTITAENFQTETQKSVEIEYDRETNRPKQIISDMAPKLLQKLVDGGSTNLPALAGVLGSALASKDIQVYFRDEATQLAAADFGWTGELRPVPDGDYLAVVDTNIAGGKTDGVIDEVIHHEMRIEDTGAIVDTVTITRSHLGKSGELFTGIKNIDFMRVYVPTGSTFLSAEGFQAPGEGYFLPPDDTLKPSTLLAAVTGPISKDATSGTQINEESGLTVFGNWVQLEPGETKSVKISYRLPFRLQDLTQRPDGWAERLKDVFGAYVPTAEMKLVVRKQPGAFHRSFESRVILPTSWKIGSSVPEEASASPQGLTLGSPLDRDLYVGMILVNGH